MSSKEANDSRSVILRQVASIPVLEGDLNECSLKFESWYFRVDRALKPLPDFHGFLTSDVATPTFARPDKSARLPLIAAMGTSGERRIAMVNLELELEAWKKYDSFVLNSGMLYTAIISIIKPGSNAYSLVVSDKIGSVKSLMVSLKAPPRPCNGPTTLSHCPKTQ